MVMTCPNSRLIIQLRHFPVTNRATDVLIPDAFSGVIKAIIELQGNAL
jgi:hypothetical protein